MPQKLFLNTLLSFSLPNNSMVSLIVLNTCFTTWGLLLTEFNTNLITLAITHKHENRSVQRHNHAHLPVDKFSVTICGCRAVICELLPPPHCVFLGLKRLACHTQFQRFFEMFHTQTLT